MPQVHVQDGKWSWIVCISATLSWLVGMGFVFSFGIFFPVFIDYFQESREKTECNQRATLKECETPNIAWLGSLAIALIFFSGHASGVLVRRFGCRVTTLFGGFLCTLSLGLSSLATNIDVLFLTYSVLYGVGVSCVFSASLNIISMYFNKWRSMATGIVMCGQGGGVLILGPLLQTMIDTFDWQNTYKIMAGVVPLLYLSGLTYSPNVQIPSINNDVVEEDDKKNGEGDNRKEGQNGVELEDTQDQKNKSGWRVYITVWKEPKFVVTVISSSVMMFTHHVPQIHLVKYCEEIGIEAGAASRLFVYYGIASCVGRLVSGRLCDFEKVNTFYVYQTAELVTGASIIVVTRATSYAHMVVFIVIYGFCDGAFITTLNVLVLTCVSPPKIPVSISWVMQINSFFLASGSPIAGLMADSLNSYTHAFYMSGTVVIAGACIPFLLLFTKKRGSEKQEAVELDNTRADTGTEPGSNGTNVASTNSVYYVTKL